MLHYLVALGIYHSHQWSAIGICALVLEVVAGRIGGLAEFGGNAFFHSRRPVVAHVYTQARVD